MPSVRTPKSVQRRDPAIYQDTAQHGDRLVVDHCHDSGEIRGLLCTRCNILLGMAKDSETTLASAIEYLRTARRG